MSLQWIWEGVRRPFAMMPSMRLEAIMPEPMKPMVGIFGVLVGCRCVVVVAYRRVWSD